MSKIKSRFIALLVVFTSIISFLPVGFSGQAAKAADIPAEATAVRVNVGGSSTPLTQRIDSKINETIYTTESVETAFDITVQNVEKSQPEIEADARSKAQSVTGVLKQEIVLLAINETILVNSDGTENALGKTVVDGMGIEIGNNPSPIKGDSQRIGVTITGLPAGINKIKYAVKLTTLGVTYKATTDDKGVKVETVTPDDKSKTYTAYEESITIEHANKYVVDKISDMLFKSYVGDAKAFDNDKAIDNTKDKNTVPFLYLTTVKPDSNMPLRYNFDVPDSLDSLKYVMTFGNMLNLSGVELYKNGVKATEGTDYSIDGQNLTGDLANSNKADLIVIKINSTVDSGASAVKIAKAYAIEIRYNKLNANEDFSLSKAGITKNEMNDDDNVAAYIGKVFIVKPNAAGFKEYNGDIYIDPRAAMISIDPDLIRSKSSVAYVVTNNYMTSTGMRVEQSRLKDGKQFVNFNMTGASSNQIQVDVFEGSNGSKTQSSKILARYYLNVHLSTESAFDMGLKFSGTGNTYLTQPGVKENGISFNKSRRTYDLYYGSPDVESVNVELTGSTEDIHQYIRVFTADGINSSDFVETQSSKDNELDSLNVRKPNIDVALNKTTKKMAVQAYYDKIENQTVKDESGNQVQKDVVVGSYPIGDKYVFYLPENYDSTDNPTPEENSTDALLKSLKLTGYSLTDVDGNKAFSSDTFDYTATVEKEDTAAKITATVAPEKKVKSIVATIDGAEESYDLVSGEETELPLSSGGKTTISIVVTAQDGTTTKTYSIIVKNNTKSNNVNLKNVVLSGGDYTFDSKNDITKVRVDQNVTSTKVTPIAEDPKSKVTVNGEQFLESAISVSLKGTQKTEINIEVTSEDGKASKTYTLEVYRVDFADWQEDPSKTGEDATQDDQFYDEYSKSWVDLTKYDEWGSVNGKPAYFDKKSRQVKDAWISTGGKLYYLNNLGYRASGWKIDDVNGKTYYLDPTTGEMKKGWMNLNNSWYYLQLNGVMQKGWLNLNQKSYYFLPNGQMVTNQSMYIDGQVCNFGQDGVKY